MTFWLRVATAGERLMALLRFDRQPLSGGSHSDYDYPRKRIIVRTRTPDYENQFAFARVSAVVL